MEINNKARIHWACRRGMRELDLAILPFFMYEYDTLNNHDKHLFVRLLQCDDVDIFHWLMNYQQPQEKKLQRIIQLIQMRNSARGPVAVRTSGFIGNPIIFAIGA